MTARWHSASTASTADALGGWTLALCGSISGGITAAVTTPFDVLKTRIMLARRGEPIAATDVLRRILVHEGAGALLSGLGPRVAWIALGGTVFFGTYEQSKRLLHRWRS